MSLLVNDRTEHLKFRYAVYMVIPFVLLLWTIKAVELATGISLAKLGILPRTLKGAIGIITGPLIHGDLFHLISNTLPILFLGVLLFYFYHRIALEIFVWIYLVTGFWTWLFARSAYHIGASGVVYGIAAFLFFSGILRKSRPLMTVSGIIIFLYGGLIYGVFPAMVEFDVSWESHLMGAIVGVLLAIVFRKAKIDFTQDILEEKAEDENEPDIFNHTGSTNDIEIRYEYKPRDPDKP